MADTIKTLSDFSIPATVVLIGVADSVDELIGQHQSIERAIIQIPMPRMSKEEIEQIAINGLERLKLKIADEAWRKLRVFPKDFLTLPIFWPCTAPVLRSPEKGSRSLCGMSMAVSTWPLINGSSQLSRLTIT